MEVCRIYSLYMDDGLLLANIVQVLQSSLSVAGSVPQNLFQEFLHALCLLCLNACIALASLKTFP